MVVFLPRDAKRGIAIECHPSVRTSVCNYVGRSGPHRLLILENNCTDN